MPSRREYVSAQRSSNAFLTGSYRAVSLSNANTPAANRVICSGCVSISKFRGARSWSAVIPRRAHEDIYVAIRDAFDATRRLLEDHVRQGRGDVKLHAVPDHGRIARLLPDRDCGFILSADSSEIYFHRNSVTNGGFEKLAVGDEVRFVVQDSESAEGSQASTVVPLGKHHLPATEAVRT
jgi:cold shock CspA family protein